MSDTFFQEPVFAEGELREVAGDAVTTPTEPLPKPEAKPKQSVSVIPVTPTGLVMARDNAELIRVIKLMMTGMAFPKTLDTEAKVIAAWQVAASLRLPPAVAIQNLAIIQGSVCMWGQLPKALAESTGQIEEFKLIRFDDAQKEICFGNKNLDAEVWGTVCQIRRSQRSMNEYSFTLLDANKAGLTGKKGPWQEYRSIMYARRCVAHAVKFEFPDAVMGVGVAEYDFHQAPDLVDVTPSSDGKAAARAKIEQSLNGGMQE